MRFGLLALVLPALVVGGCAAPPKVVRTYAGSPRPAQEIAIVRSKRNGIFVGSVLSGHVLDIAVAEVDNTAVPIGDWIWQVPPAIELEPGTHTLTLVIDQGGSIVTPDAPRPMLALEAGHVYELRGRRAPNPKQFGTSEARFAWEWWIVDVTMGTTLASNVPASPR